MIYHYAQRKDLQVYCHVATIFRTSKHPSLPIKNLEAIFNSFWFERPDQIESIAFQDKRKKCMQTRFEKLPYGYTAL